MHLEHSIVSRLYSRLVEGDLLLNVQTYVVSLRTTTLINTKVHKSLGEHGFVFNHLARLEITSSEAISPIKIPTGAVFRLPPPNRKRTETGLTAK